MKLLRNKIIIAIAMLLIICLGTLNSDVVGYEEKEAPVNPFFLIYQNFFNENVKDIYMYPDNIYFFGYYHNPN